MPLPGVADHDSARARVRHRSDGFRHRRSRQRDLAVALPRRGGRSAGRLEGQLRFLFRLDLGRGAPAEFRSAPWSRTFIQRCFDLGWFRNLGGGRRRRGSRRRAGRQTAWAARPASRGGPGGRGRRSRRLDGRARQQAFDIDALADLALVRIGLSQLERRRDQRSHFACASTMRLGGRKRFGRQDRQEASAAQYGPPPSRSPLRASADEFPQRPNPSRDGVPDRSASRLRGPSGHQGFRDYL